MQVDSTKKSSQVVIPSHQVARFPGFSAGHFLTSTVAEPRKENAANAGGLKPEGM